MGVEAEMAYPIVPTAGTVVSNCSCGATNPLPSPGAEILITGSGRDIVSFDIRFLLVNDLDPRGGGGGIPGSCPTMGSMILVIRT